LFVEGDTNKYRKKKAPIFVEFPTNMEAFGTPSSGLEPEFQEPESCVLSIAPRGHYFGEDLSYNSEVA
jgi:hypothetical protein